MKVRVIKTPSFAPGGLYDGGYKLSPGEMFGVTSALGTMASGIYGLTHESDIPSSISSLSGSSLVRSFSDYTKKIQDNMFGKSNREGDQNIQKMFHDQITRNNAAGITPINSTSTSGNPKSSNESERSQSLINGKRLPVNTLNGPINLAAASFQIGGGIFYNQSMQPLSRRRPLARTFKKHQEGGQAQPSQQQVDPQTAAIINNVANAIKQGNDPNDIVAVLEEKYGSHEQAVGLVQYAMQALNATSNTQLPQYGYAAFGGEPESMGNDEFQPPTGKPYVIDTPLMKDGGQTFVTSQPAYTQKSVNYFGTSNAPARDSYVDNNQVTTSVKAVPREDATIEAEKGEYIFSDKGLYKIEGKKHSQGGTPLAAKGGEFIYSDHKDMYIEPELQVKANLKKPSSSKFKENTPAKVLERNIDTKEYNRLKSIVSDPKHDAITKKTAQFMLEKMDNKLQVIAKLQEANKQSDPVEFKDQYLEQPEVQNDVNEQKQFAYGGMPMYEPGGTTASGTMFSGAQSDVNSAQSKQQAEAYEKALRSEGYTGRSILGLDYSKKHDEIGEAQKWAAEHFGPQIADYLRTQKPSRAVEAMLHGRDIKDKTKVTDQELLAAYPDQYWSWRGYVPTVNKPAPYSSGQQIGVKEEDHDMDLDIKQKENLPFGGSDYNIHDPYAKVRGMQASQYLNNVASNKPYFTYAAAVNSPITEAGRMSSQPFMDEAAKARYSANQLASKFGDSTQRMVAAAQQNDAVNKGLFEVNKYNTEAEAQNRAQNALRSSAAVNTWNDRQKQAYDQNTNVLDKMNYLNAAYYNQFSSARQKDMLEKYYKLRQEKMNLLSSAEAQPRTDRYGRVFNDIVFPINESGEINPSWNGWNTNLVNSLTDDKNSGLDALQKELNSTNLSDQQKNEIIANYFTNKYGKSKTSK